MGVGLEPEGGLGALLRRYRSAAGLTQEELAMRSGVSIRALSDMERGRTLRPGRRSIELLADALELTESARAGLMGARRGIAAGAGPGGSAEGASVCQLPAPVRYFTGRAAELRMLDDVLGQAVPGGDEPLIAAITGTAGVGKTALAVRWGRQHAAEFPDGQLYVNLCGFGPVWDAVSPAEALGGFLDALRVPAGQVPATLAGRQALYRQLVAGRRILVVLDNARDPAQVRPLLPGSPGSMVLVTSRDELTGLVCADGARLVGLDVLTVAEAGQLLAARLGSARLAAEPAAAAELIALCARLPLALAVTTARAAARPRFPLAALAAGLRDERGRLDALTTGEETTDPRAVFSWSYHQLSPAAAWMFRLAGLHPGPDISAAAAASMGAVRLAEARRLLRELTHGNMLAEPAPDRYAPHDLLRAYAAELAQAADDEQARRAAVGRVFDHYLHTGSAASQCLDPYRELEPLSGSLPGVRPEEMTSLAQALEWFRAERRVLVAAIGQAAGDGSDAYAWQLPWVIAPFLDGQGFWQELEATQQIALAAARRLGNLAAQAHAHHFLGSAYLSLGAHHKAAVQLTAALSFARQIGAGSLQAREHSTLVVACIRQGRFGEALGHARQAQRLSLDLGHRYGQAHSLNSVGWCHAQLGNFQEALKCCREALAMYRELHYVPGEAATLDSLGYAHHHLGNYAEAIACYQQAIGLLGDTGDPDDLAEFLTHLGDACHSADDHEAARRAWQQGLAIIDGLQHPAVDQLRSRLARNAAGNSTPPDTVSGAHVQPGSTGIGCGRPMA